MTPYQPNANNHIRRPKPGKSQQDKDISILQGTGGTYSPAEVAAAKARRDARYPQPQKMGHVYDFSKIKAELAHDQHAPPQTPLSPRSMFTTKNSEWVKFLAGKAGDDTPAVAKIANGRSKTEADHVIQKSPSLIQSMTTITTDVPLSSLIIPSGYEVQQAILAAEASATMPSLAIIDGSGGPKSTTKVSRLSPIAAVFIPVAFTFPGEPVEELGAESSDKSLPTSPVKAVEELMWELTYEPLTTDSQNLEAGEESKVDQQSATADFPSVEEQVGDEEILEVVDRAASLPGHQNLSSSKDQTHEGQSVQAADLVEKPSVHVFFADLARSPDGDWRTLKFVCQIFDEQTGSHHWKIVGWKVQVPYSMVARMYWPLGQKCSGQKYKFGRHVHSRVLNKTYPKRLIARYVELPRITKRKFGKLQVELIEHDRYAGEKTIKESVISEVDELRDIGSISSFAADDQGLDSTSELSNSQLEELDIKTVLRLLLAEREKNATLITEVEELKVTSAEAQVEIVELKTKVEELEGSSATAMAYNEAFAREFGMLETAFVTHDAFYKEELAAKSLVETELASTNLDLETTAKKLKEMTTKEAEVTADCSTLLQIHQDTLTPRTDLQGRLATSESSLQTITVKLKEMTTKGAESTTAQLAAEKLSQETLESKALVDSELASVKLSLATTKSELDSKHNLEAELHTVKQALAAAEKTISQDAITKSGLGSSNAGFKKANKELSSAKKDADEKVELFTKAIETAHQSEAGKDRRITKLSFDLSTLKKTNKDLTGTTQAVKLALQLSDAALMTSAKNLATKDSKVSTLAATNEGLEHSVLQLSAAKLDHEDALRTAHSKLATTTTALATNTTQLAEANEAIERLGEDNTTLLAQVELNTAHNNTINNRLCFMAFLALLGMVVSGGLGGYMFVQQQSEVLPSPTVMTNTNADIGIEDILGTNVSSHQNICWDHTPKGFGSGFGLQTNDTPGAGAIIPFQQVTWAYLPKTKRETGLSSPFADDLKGLLASLDDLPLCSANFSSYDGLPSIFDEPEDDASGSEGDEEGGSAGKKAGFKLSDHKGKVAVVATVLVGAAAFYWALW